MKKVIVTRKWKSLDNSLLESRLQEILSEIDVEKVSIEESINLYESSLTELFDDLCPLKARTITLRENSPWYNDDIRAAKQLRRKLERKWRRSRLATDRQLYEHQRQVVIQLMEKAKTDFYSSAVDQCSSNMKALYRLINKLLHRKGDPIVPTSSSDEDLAESFSSYFFDKILRIRNDLEPYVRQSADNHDSTSSGESHLTDFSPVSIEEVRKLIMDSPSKSCDLDPLPTWLLKAHVDAFAPFYTKLINKMFQVGCFPENLKHAVIKPLLKKSGLDKEALSNYRPIANLKFLSKLAERAVSRRLSTTMSCNQLDDPFQSAYKKNHSVETATLRVSNDILQAMDQGLLTALVLLDLSSAFDTVDHDLELKQLREQGINGSALDWFRSYLDDRTQSVQVGNATSRPVPLSFSVPQGSVLGPQLFSIYILPIRDIISKHGLCYHIYADDIQIYASCPSTQDAVDSLMVRLEACLSDIKDWMRKHFLKLNDSKSEFALFGSSQQRRKVVIPNLMVGDTVIAPVDQVRSLGLLLDATMTMEPQIANCIKSSIYHLRNIHKVKRYLNPQALKSLIHAFITSRLDIHNATLLGLPQCQVHKLQKIQNVAARMISGTSRFEHISPVLMDLHWLPVKKRVDFKLLVITY